MSQSIQGLTKTFCENLVNIILSMPISELTGGTSLRGPAGPMGPMGPAGPARKKKSKRRTKVIREKVLNKTVKESKEVTKTKKRQHPETGRAKRLAEAKKTVKSAQ